jgi:hypothetical protein
MAILASAKNDGVTIDVVNIMAMDYGSSVDNGGEMGLDAINAAIATEKQIGGLGLSSKLGVTAMIGVNDISSEVFTLADAQSLVNYARTDPNIVHLAMWSVARDNGNSAGAHYASPDSSGIAQQPYDFSSIFHQFDGNGNTAVYHCTPGHDFISAIGNMLQGYADDGNDDQIYFQGSQNQLFGGTGNDWLGVSGNNNALIGGSGNNWIGATGNSNTLAAGSGNSTLLAVGTGNFFYAGAGRCWEGVSGSQNQILVAPAPIGWARPVATTPSPAAVVPPPYLQTERATRSLAAAATIGLE